MTAIQLLSDIVEEPVEWLWQGRIPFGEITILEGLPGTNKSSLAADVAARLTQGQAMPGVASGRRLTGGAIFLVGEDSLAKTVRGRLLAAGGDLTKIGVLDAVSIPDDIGVLEKAIHKVNAKLVVVDTLNDFLNANVLGNQAVRRALRPLRELAERTNVGVVVLRHFVKSRSNGSLLRGGGTVAITAMARSQLKLYPHPNDHNMRVLLQDKSNLGPLSPGLAFEVVPTERSLRLEWHGETALTAEDLEVKHKGSPALEWAERFLLENLAKGPQEVNWLIDQAQGHCSRRTLDTGKHNLDIQTVRKGKGKGHKVYWQLPAKYQVFPDLASAEYQALIKDTEGVAS